MRSIALALVLLCVASASAEQPDPWSDLELQRPEAAQPQVIPVADELAATEQQAISRTTANSGTPTSETQRATEPGWLRSTLSLVAVVSLIGLLAWGYRAATGNSTLPLGRPRRQGLIEVISRTTLGPRQSVALVRCGPRMVLVGMSGESMNALDVITDATLVADLAGEQLRRTSQADPFAAVMRGEAAQYDEPEIDETRGSEESSLSAAKRGLTATIEKLRAAQRRGNAS